MPAKTHDELIRQLETAEAGNHGVEAVFSIHSPDPGQKFATPEQTESVVKKLIKRLEVETGESPEDYNIFKNLGTFAVAASPRFVRRIMDQSEIASALANRDIDMI
jgi:hypothetical protein